MFFYFFLQREIEWKGGLNILDFYIHRGEVKISGAIVYIFFSRTLIFACTYTAFVSIHNSYYEYIDTV